MAMSLLAYGWVCLFPADALDDCTRDLHARIEAAFRGETHEGDHERGVGTSGGGLNLQVAWSDCCDEVLI